MFKRKISEEEKLKKQTQKNKSAIADSLKFSDLYEVRKDALILKKGSKEEIVRGIKVIPSNLFLEEEDMQMFRISLYRQALNNINSHIYHAMVFNPIDVRIQTQKLTDRLVNNPSLTPYQELLIKESLSKLNLFTANNRELEFFLMVKGKNDKRFAKEFSDLVRFFKAAQFQIKELDAVDFENYIANTFENDLINDFYFAKGEFERLAEEYNLNKSVDDTTILFEGDEWFEVYQGNDCVERSVSGRPNLSLDNPNLKKNTIYSLVSYHPNVPNHKRILFDFVLGETGLVMKEVN